MKKVIWWQVVVVFLAWVIPVVPVWAEDPSPQSQGIFIMNFGDSGGSVTDVMGEDLIKNRRDLAWLMIGLNELGKSKDKKLRLTPAQAKKILPELETLEKENLLLTKLPEINGDVQTKGVGGPDFNGTGSPGNIIGGAPSMIQMDSNGKNKSKEQKQLEAHMKEMADKILVAIEKCENTLTSGQLDYILNIHFEPGLYGLESPGNQANSVSVKEAMKKQQDGMMRLVKLNQDVLTMLRKLTE